MKRSQMKIVHREPSDKEFKAFKKELIENIRRNRFNPDGQKEIKSLLTQIGVMESELSESQDLVKKKDNQLNDCKGKLGKYSDKLGDLRHVLNCEQNSTKNIRIQIKQMMDSPNHLYLGYARHLLGELLFIELKTGTLYS